MKHFVLPLLLIGLTGRLLAQDNFEPSFATVNGVAFDLNATTALADFDGADLGTFTLNSDQLLLGSEMYVLNDFPIDSVGLTWALYDSEGQNVGGVNTYYGQYVSSSATADRYDVRNATRPDLLDVAGLVEGIYTVEVSLQGTYILGDFDFQTFFEDNGGANYIASFQVVPEISSIALAMLLGLTGWGILRKRAR